MRSRELPAIHLSFWQKFFFPAIRKIPPEPGQKKVFYLTFDDGPDVTGTPVILDLLSRFRARATFFLIAKKALASPEFINRILQEGHAIGNHSFDHRYTAFFTGHARMRAWVQKAEDAFVKLGVRTVGFRPPAGVRTPELHLVLAELQLPLVLWNKRFFDTRFRWTQRAARKALDRLPSGSIILLHDRQRPEYLEEFLQTLALFLAEGNLANIEFRSLPRIR